MVIIFTNSNSIYFIVECIFNIFSIYNTSLEIPSAVLLKSISSFAFIILLLELRLLFSISPLCILFLLDLEQLKLKSLLKLNNKFGSNSFFEMYLFVINDLDDQQYKIGL